MDSPLGILKFVVPQIPSLSYTAASHSLGFSPTSSKWDLRTAMTVEVLRKFMGGGGRGKQAPPIEKIQAQSSKDTGVKGKMWIAKATIAKPDDHEGGVREAVFKAVEDMNTTGGKLSYTKPEFADIEVEWTGYRSGVGEKEALPDISEEEKYNRLMADPNRTSETTILYFHGGAYYLADPVTHRPLTSKLAQESKGRVCSVRYRLAPQTAFPGQLIDALMVYLSLLYPPPGSLHEAVSAEKIVVGGDSAGGNLAFSLLQLLLQMHRSANGVPVVRFHDRDVHVPIPAGVSSNSGWFDIARALPSISANAIYDYLPPPNHDDAVSRFPKSAVWPTDPPRGDLLCDLSLLDHPLFTLVLAQDWKTSPPLWMCTGQECLTDEDLLVAAKTAQQGVTVHFEQYEAMPHCFAMLMPFLPTAERCVKSWADWCRKCVEEPQSLKTNGVYVHAKTGKEDVIEVEKVGTVSDEEAKRLVGEAKERRLRGWDKEGKMMPKPPAL